MYSSLLGRHKKETWSDLPIKADGIGLKICSWNWRFPSSWKSSKGRLRRTRPTALKQRDLWRKYCWRLFWTTLITTKYSPQGWFLSRERLKFRVLLPKTRVMAPRWPAHLKSEAISSPNKSVKVKFLKMCYRSMEDLFNLKGVKILISRHQMFFKLWLLQSL